MRRWWQFISLGLVLFGGAIRADAQGGDELPKLRPIRTEIPLTYWEREGRELTLHVAEFVAWLGFTAWLLARPYPKAEEPVEVVTRRELERLRRQPHSTETVSEVARVIRSYFIAGFRLPAGEHTTTEFCTLLQGSDRVGLALAERTANFLRRGDAARFAPAGSHAAGIVPEAAELIAAAEARRQELRMLESARTWAHP